MTAGASGPLRALARRPLRDTFRAARGVILARIYLRRCTRVGHLTKAYGRPSIRNEGSIVIGERVLMRSTIVPVELVTLGHGAIEIGDRTFVNYGVSIQAGRLVSIGADCLLGSYVNILDNDWHGIEDRRLLPQSRPVILEDNVWLGNRVIVLPGVMIGKDSVVGAGAVVVTDVPPRSVAVGSPARVVKTF